MKTHFSLATLALVGLLGACGTDAAGPCGANGSAPAAAVCNQDNQLGGGPIQRRQSGADPLANAMAKERDAEQKLRDATQRSAELEQKIQADARERELASIKKQTADAAARASQPAPSNPLNSALQSAATTLSGALTTGLSNAISGGGSSGRSATPPATSSATTGGSGSASSTSPATYDWDAASRVNYNPNVWTMDPIVQPLF